MHLPFIFMLAILSCLGEKVKSIGIFILLFSFLTEKDVIITFTKLLCNLGRRLVSGPIIPNNSYIFGLYLHFAKSAL